MRRVKINIPLCTSDAPIVSIHSKSQLRNLLVGTSYQSCGLILLSPYMSGSYVVLHSGVLLMALICALLQSLFLSSCPQIICTSLWNFLYQFGNPFYFDYLSILITSMVSSSGYDNPFYLLYVKDKAHSICSYGFQQYISYVNYDISVSQYIGIWILHLHWIPVTCEICIHVYLQIFSL